MPEQEDWPESEHSEAAAEWRWKVVQMGRPSSGEGGRGVKLDQKKETRIVVESCGNRRANHGEPQWQRSTDLGSHPKWAQLGEELRCARDSDGSRTERKRALHGRLTAAARARRQQARAGGNTGRAADSQRPEDGATGARGRVQLEVAMLLRRTGQRPKVTSTSCEAWGGPINVYTCAQT